MAYCVKLENFEGPLDLLLHLVSKSRVKIEDISITEITEQYMDYLEVMQKFDIEIASEFLLMAATLLYIKSRLLVPKPSEQSDEEGPDPQQELILRLEEYKKYKEAGEYLRRREKSYSGIYYKLPEEIIIEENVDSIFTGVTSQQLLNELLKILSQKRPMREKKMVIHEIKKDSISIHKRIRQLEFLFWEKNEWNFYELFRDQYTKSDIVVTFLALLEMLKSNDVEVRQENPFDDIIIRRRERHE